MAKNLSKKNLTAEGQKALDQAVAPFFSHQQLQITHQQQQQITRSPFPAPEMIAAYEKVLPGMAERIVKLTEEEAAHRRETERRVTKAQVWDAFLARGIEFGGQVSGLVVCIVAIVYGSSTAIAGHPIFGVSLTWADLAVS